MQDALEKGATKIIVRTVDTDVVVILVGVFFELLDLYRHMQLWVAFGKGKNFAYLNIYDISNTLGKNKSRDLPVFHAFTDTTSHFFGKGKKSAWQAWRSYHEVTEGFLFLTDHPFETVEITDRAFAMLERFTCVLYDNTTVLNQLCQDGQRITTRTLHDKDENHGEHSTHAGK